MNGTSCWSISGITIKQTTDGMVRYGIGIKGILVSPRGPQFFFKYFFQHRAQDRRQTFSSQKLSKHRQNSRPKWVSLHDRVNGSTSTSLCAISRTKNPREHWYICDQVSLTHFFATILFKSFVLNSFVRRNAGQSAGLDGNGKLRIY